MTLIEFKKGLKRLISKISWSLNTMPRCSPMDLDGDCRADKNPNDKWVSKRVRKRKKSNRKSYLISILFLCDILF